MSKSTRLANLEPVDGWRTGDLDRLVLQHQHHVVSARSLLLLSIQKIGGLHAENLWGLLLNHPKLMAGFLGFASRLMPFGTLERRDTELVILRVAWNCRCRYEWGQHVDIGLRAGLSVADIHNITRGSAAVEWTEKQRALLQACDDLHRDRYVSNPVWVEISRYFDTKQLIELLVLIGFYEGLAGVLNSVHLSLENKLEQQLKQL